LADFAHLDAKGTAAMVDVTAKTATTREAIVVGRVTVSPDCATRLTLTNDVDKIREIASCARVAGIMAAKKTAELIPMCHPIALTHVSFDIQWLDGENCFAIRSTAKTKGETGVEMEALIGAQIAGATIYDMIKAVDPGATVGPFAVVEKRGGKTGHWQPDESMKGKTIPKKEQLS